jgi:hypothetical protein
MADGQSPLGNGQWSMVVNGQWSMSVNEYQTSESVRPDGLTGRPNGQSSVSGQSEDRPGLRLGQLPVIDH